MRRSNGEDADPLQEARQEAAALREENRILKERLERSEHQRSKLEAALRVWETASRR